MSNNNLKTEFSDEEYEFENDEKKPVDYYTESPEKESAIDVPAAAEADKEKKSKSYLKFLPLAVLGLFLLIAGLWAAFSAGNRQNAPKQEITVTKPAVTETSDRSAEALSKVMQQQNPTPNLSPTAALPSDPAQANINSQAKLPTGYPADAVYNPYENPRPPATVIPPADDSPKPNTGNGGGPRKQSADTAQVSAKPLIVESDSNKNELRSEDGQQVTRLTGSPGRNTQRSLYFYQASAENADGQTATFQRIPFVKPAEIAIPELPFGTMLPVRTLGAVHTLNSDGLVRFELTQSVKTGDYTIPRGTIFVGRNSGGANNRVFVSLIGWIENNRLISLGGDVLNIDGSSGLQGEIKTVGSRMGRVFSKGFEMFSNLGIEYLRNRAQRQGTNNTNIYSSANPNIDELMRSAQNADAKKFVFVKSGTDAYIFVNDLPPAVKQNRTSVAASSSAPSPSNGVSSFDADLQKAIESGNDEEVQKVLSRLPKQ